jgi:hypothetical protein
MPLVYAISRKNGIKNRKPLPACGTGLKLKCSLVKAELLVETADASAGIHHLLLTGKEGVTLGAYFHLDVLFVEPVSMTLPQAHLMVVC